MFTDSKHIDRLIARFLAGEASEKEKLLLNRWMDESEVNRKYFGDIQFVNDRVVASNRIVKVDVDGAWEKVHRRMKTKVMEKRVEPKIIPLVIPLWLRVAAVVMIVSGLSLGLYRYFYLPRVQQYELTAIASADSIISRQLSDSSTVFLNRNSQITYSPSYGKKERRVRLQGEAFFDVKHIDEKPFIVETQGTLIEDIGTSFNIKAFETDTIVEVYVKSGVVRFFTSDNEGIVLKVGETGIFNKKTGKFTQPVTQNPNVISYTNNVFIFQNTRLSEAIQQLRKVYNANITIGSDSIRDCTISVTFENEEIEVILSIIAETLDLQVKFENDAFVLTGDSCENP